MRAIVPGLVVSILLLSVACTVTTVTAPAAAPTEEAGVSTEGGVVDRGPLGPCATYFTCCLACPSARGSYGACEAKCRVNKLGLRSKLAVNDATDCAYRQCETECASDEDAAWPGCLACLRDALSEVNGNTCTSSSPDQCRPAACSEPNAACLADVAVAATDGGGEEDAATTVEQGCDSAAERAEGATCASTCKTYSVNGRAYCVKACTSNSDCSAGQLCAVKATTKFCATICTSNAQCTQGFTTCSAGYSQIPTPGEGLCVY